MTRTFRILLTTLNAHHHACRRDQRPTVKESPVSTESDPIDRDSAARVHYTDPRVRRLATARWQLQTGGTHQEWLQLGKNHPQAQIQEARDWVRAAVAASIMPPPEPAKWARAEPIKADHEDRHRTNGD